MYDLHRLRLLRELAVHGTIAATAQACSLTPSAVSQQLSLLQREVGVSLLVRDGRRVLLTEAARVLVSHTERILAEMEHAHAGVAALSGSVGGVVRLAAFPTAASSLVPTAIANSQVAHPELKVRLVETEPGEGVPALKAGHLDLLLTYAYNQLPEVDDAGIELTPLITEPLYAAVAPGFSLPSGQLGLEALRDQPWIAPRSDTALRTVLERACGQAGFAPQLDYTSDDYTVILALVSAGLGVSLVPPLATEGMSADVRLCPVAEPSLSRKVSVAARTGSSHTPNFAVLLDNLRESAAQRQFPSV
ncbi:LysR family transcriptional regulator [Parasphingorhabdus pacifica]